MTNLNRNAEAELAGIVAQDDMGAIPLAEKMLMLVVACAIGLVANWAATGTSPVEALPGMAVLFGASALGLVVARIVPLSIPAVAWVSLIAIALTIPGMPGAAAVLEAVTKLNFLALATPALAYGGLALTHREFQIARQSGWKIVIVAICVMFGTYIGSVIIADLTLRFFG
ncbi:hypothetical protein [Aureimonas frigidaquae]|uniref:hypothetical protein n=1 Tax=Aureimonas frigidaquae TaxID=424757 RepID=UPI0007835225|nr:hypothetical protein [Aureimonas frigidaquae]